MAWTAPMTAVANTAFTAAQFNTHVRDNLLETAPAKATSGVPNGSYLTKTATNSVLWRSTGTNTVSTSQSSSSTSYTNLSTSGPSVTLATGSIVMVIISGDLQNNSTNSTFMSVAVSGATTLSASDDRAIRMHDGSGSNPRMQASQAFMFTTLNTGTNTFTAKYRVIGGTGTWSNRHMIVMPF